MNDIDLLKQIFITELGNEYDPERPDGFVEVRRGTKRVWHPFPGLLNDLNAINELEKQLVSRTHLKRSVFRERLATQCGDDTMIVHASARNRTIALVRTLEILRQNPDLNYVHPGVRA